MAGRLYTAVVAKKSEFSLIWHVVWGLVGGGLTFTVLSLSGAELGMPVVIGISAAAAIAVAIVGPMLLDLLALVP